MLYFNIFSHSLIVAGNSTNKYMKFIVTKAERSPAAGHCFGKGNVCTAHCRWDPEVRNVHSGTKNAVSAQRTACLCPLLHLNSATQTPLLGTKARMLPTAGSTGSLQVSAVHYPGISLALPSHRRERDSLPKVPPSVSRQGEAAHF